MGFEHRRLAPEVFEAVSKFYAANAKHRVKEIWDIGNTYVNHWEAPTYMVHLTQHLKELVFENVKPILEEWSGQTLEPTVRMAYVEDHIYLYIIDCG